MTKNPFSFSFLAYESQHADPNFVTLVAMSSFLLAFIVVVLLALMFPGRSRKDAINRVVVFFAVVAVPFGAILYANVRIIKNDRADEQATILNPQQDKIRLINNEIDIIVADKFDDCLENNYGGPNSAPMDLQEWCYNQLKYEFSGIGYENVLRDCIFGDGDVSIDSNTPPEVEKCEVNLDASWSRLSYSPGKTTTTLDDCDGTDSCYEQDTSNDFTEEDIQASLDDGPCYGDCTDMDNDGRTWDDVDADGDGRFEP